MSRSSSPSGDRPPTCAVVASSEREADSFAVEFTAGVVVVTGELDAHTVPVLDAMARRAVADGPLVLDMVGVDFIDSSGLRCLLEFGDQVDRVVLRSPSPAALRLLEITGTTDRFVIDAR